MHKEREEAEIKWMIEEYYADMEEFQLGQLQAAREERNKDLFRK